MQFDPVDALAQALVGELHRVPSSPLHGAIEVSIESDSLSNGINYCSVQVGCRASCGWRIVSYGREAKALERKAREIQTFLQNRTNAAICPTSEVLKVFFPGVAEIDKNVALSKTV